MSRPKQPNVPSRCDMKTGDPDLDLTGSPLKDDFQLEDIEDMSIEKEEHYKLWSETEESYSGVSVDLARDIVNDIGEMEESSRKCGPVWLLCNGSDLERTLLLVNEISADWWSRGVVVEQEPISIEIVKMENLMAQHLDRYPGKPHPLFRTNPPNTNHLHLIRPQDLRHGDRVHLLPQAQHSRARGYGLSPADPFVHVLPRRASHPQAGAGHLGERWRAGRRVLVQHSDAELHQEVHPGTFVVESERAAV